MFKYIRFTLVHVWLMAGTIGLFMGGKWLWLGLAVTLTLFVLGDALAGKDLSVPKYKHTWLFNILLYSTLPSLLVLLAGVAWAFGSGDRFGISAIVEQYTGYDMIAARAQSTIFDYVGAVFNVSILIVLAGTNVGHELTHRTWDPVSMCIGRSTVGQIRSAWHLEKERLHKLRHGTWTWRNRILRGHLMSATLAAGAYYLGGWGGLGGFLICAAGGKAGLEVINFIEHYGLCRIPGQPVQPRHSWNSNAKMSGYTLFNLTRHSDHHAHGDKPFWTLLPYPDAPMMPYGYITMLLIALCPPVWKRMMAPLLDKWDRTEASPEERILADQQNKESGLHFPARSAA